MEEIRKVVRSAQWRLVLEQFCRSLAWCWFVGLACAAVATLVAALVVIPGVPFQTWVMGWVAAGLGLGLIAAGVRTFILRTRNIEAAIEVDKRFGLRERLSSSISLDADEMSSPAAQALLVDAIRKAEGLEISERFPIQLPKTAWLPFAAGATVFLLSMLGGAKSIEQPVQASAVVQKQVQSEAQTLAKKLSKQLEENKEALKGLEEFKGLLKKIEEGAKDLAKSDKADRKDALKKLNDLAQDLEKRRDELGINKEKLQEQFKSLKNLGKGPAEKLADKLQNGDFKDAVKELQKMKDQIDSGKFDAEQMKHLEKQLDAAKRQLEEAAEQQKKKIDALKKQMADLQKAGQKEEAEKVKKELARAESQQQQMEQLQQMAKKMGQCSECLSKGDKAGAAKAMAALGEDLKSMSKAMEEMEMLEGAMSELQACKDGMCQGMGSDMESMQMSDNSSNSPNAKNRGRGAGDRPEEATDTNSYLTKVDQKPRGGTQIVAGEAEGENLKGEVREQIRATLELGSVQEADALDDVKLPRNKREHAKEYFEALNNNGL